MRRSEVATAVLALEDAEGRLTPEAVLEAARDPDSPLHAQFTWDDRIAAEEHRLDQARRLIVSVKMDVTVNRVTVSVPFYVRDPNAETHQQGYIGVMRIKSDRDAAHEVLTQEMARAAALLKRARHLAVVLEMQDRVDAIMGQVAGFMSELEAESEEPQPPEPSPRRRGRWRKGGGGREARV